MKRILLSVAILAVAASCSKNEVVDTPQTNEITFSTLNDRVVSKAANDGDDNYAVLANLSSDNTGATWYIDDTATVGSETYSGSGITTDKLTYTYYYPGSSEYTLDFYAYAPATSETITTNTKSVASGEATVTLDYTVGTKADEDFTIASKVEQKKTSGNDLTDTNVAFTFAHMLSKVTVIVEVDESLAGYFVTDSDDEILAMNSTCACSDDATCECNCSEEECGCSSGSTCDCADCACDCIVPINNTDGITAALSLAKDSGTAYVTGDNIQTWSNQALSSGNADYVTYEDNTTYMVLPQTLDTYSTLALENVKIVNRSTGYVAFTGQLADIALVDIKEEITTFTAFEQGYHYQFTITITNLAKDTADDPIFGAEITFTSTTADWTDYYSSIVDDAANATLTNLLTAVTASRTTADTADTFNIAASGITIESGTKIDLTIDASEFVANDTIVFTFDSLPSGYEASTNFTITDSNADTAPYCTFAVTATDTTANTITVTVTKVTV